LRENQLGYQCNIYYHLSARLVRLTWF